MPASFAGAWPSVMHLRHIADYLPTIPTCLSQNQDAWWARGLQALLLTRGGFNARAMPEGFYIRAQLDRDRPYACWSQVLSIRTFGVVAPSPVTCAAKFGVTRAFGPAQALARFPVMARSCAVPRSHWACLRPGITARPGGVSMRKRLRGERTYIIAMVRRATHGTLAQGGAQTVPRSGYADHLVGAIGFPQDSIPAETRCRYGKGDKVQKPLKLAYKHG